MTEFTKIYQSVMDGEDDIACEQAQILFEQGHAPMEIINNGLIAAMNEVGVLFKEGELFVPEVMMSAQTVTAAIEVLKPHMAGKVEMRGRVVIGTVKGDLHDIGKNLVALMLSSNGFEVIDLGNDVAPEDFVTTVKDHDVKIVALSALLTTTMVNMEETVLALVNAGIRDKVKVVIGGAPVTAEFAAEINADGYAEDAQGAVDFANQVMGR